jgi:preprotein translocase subunit SecF
LKVLPSVKKLVHFIFVNDILVYEKIKLKMHGVPKNEMPTMLDFSLSQIMKKTIVG